MKMLGLRCSVNRESGEFPERWRMVAMTLTKVCAQDTNNKQHFGVDVEHLENGAKPIVWMETRFYIKSTLSDVSSLVWK